MPVVSWRVDERSLNFFLRFCDTKGLTKQEGFKRLVDEFKQNHTLEERKYEKTTKSEVVNLWVSGEKKDIISHLHRVFADFGGELKKEGRCFLINDRFVIYVLFRTLSKEESRVVKVSGSCVRQLENIARDSGREPLIAVLAKPDGVLPFVGLLPLDAVETVEVEKGSRNARYPFFRRKNGESMKHKTAEEDAVFIHVRHEQDKMALQTACGKGEGRPDWAKAFYGE